MKRACLLAALVAILVPFGCGKKGAGLSGTYKAKLGSPSVDVTMTFQDDGTFVAKTPSKVVKGTYKLEGRKLSVTKTLVNGEPTQNREPEPTTATLSEDGNSFRTGALEYVKQGSRSQGTMPEQNQ